MFVLTNLLIGWTLFVHKKPAPIETNNILTRRVQSSTISEADYKAQNTLSILFVGDLMFDRYIRQISEKNGSDFVFAGVSKLLSENDLVVGNLEGPITDNLSVSVGSASGARDNYIFTFNSDVASNLWKNNIKIVDIGNNHILNFGDSGLSQTKEYLKKNNIDFFGDPDGENRMLVLDKNNIKIAFVSYNQFEKDGQAKALDDIKVAKKRNVDKVILYTHWGKEFTTEPDETIKQLAHSFVDAGADLIIGSHPHVVQGKEQYAGKMIYYSLGNFIFDQYFSPETQKGLAVKLEMNRVEKRIVLSEFSVTMKSNGQTVQDRQ